jgi:feruloyl-CoA synthase
MSAAVARLEDTKAVPFRALNVLPPAVTVEPRADGSFLLRDPRPCVDPEQSIIDWLRHWSETTPDRTMLAQRDADGRWNRRSYARMRAEADAVGQALLDRGIAPGETILILSGNSIEHAVLALGAMTIGVTIAPVSPVYALMPSGHAKLRRVFDIVRPVMIFAQNAREFAAGLDALGAPSLPLVTVTDLDGRATGFDALLATTSTPAVDAAYAATGPDTVAKILFSSGSTGWPKGIINTQRMMCLNQAMHDTLWHADQHTGPFETLNWMPWNHTMAGNGLFNRSLRQGGTYYIDDGRPLAGEFERTVANLRELSPHSHSDVPSGFAMLAAALEAEPPLRDRFFQNLVFLQYAGASLPVELWQRFQQLSVKATGHRIPFLTGYGCTEAGPSITQVYWAVEGSGYIGVPMPGVEVKLIPVDDSRYELRARGRNITPGYVGDATLYAAAFDAEGFYRTGDSVTFVNGDDPGKGLRFASRVAEDFKLLTGTFVAVGSLRASVVGASMPLVRDLVVSGENRGFVGALIWPDPDGCRALLGAAGTHLGDAQVIAAAPVRAALRAALEAWNQANPASSTRIARAVLLTEPPSAEAGEITDKGYVNQRRALECRAAFVDALYTDRPGHEVLVIDSEQGLRS